MGSLNSNLLNVYAGSEALTHIQSSGLDGDDISMVLGASSGPKWLALHGIDRFLLSSFFASRNRPLHVFGTSAGAWRMACYAQANPLEAHARLSEAYIEQSYSNKPSGREIQDSCEQMVSAFLGSNGEVEILNNEHVFYSLVTTQCHGWSASANKAFKSAGFGFAALSNLLHRRLLGMQFTRVLMHRSQRRPPISHFDDLPSREVALQGQNLKRGIIATGCIPIIIDGVENLAGKGMYQDGGITDYGFDLPFMPKRGFVLYPHFADLPSPGWFDKKLKWRQPKQDNYKKVVMIVPSRQFVGQLPFNKIPDRNDFLRMPNSTRQRYWRETLEHGQRLSEELANLDWAKRVRPLPW